MRRTLQTAIVVILALLVVAPAASAHNTDLRHDAKHRYYDCLRAADKDTCGRHVIRDGWKVPKKKAVEPTRAQISRWSKQLAPLTVRRPYLAITGGGPRVPAGYGAATARYRPVGLAACIVHHESRGNPRASNGSHWGIGQWTIEAWLRHGGGRYGRHPFSATYQQQLVVLSQGLARYGCRDWCPFDPC